VARLKYATRALIEIDEQAEFLAVHSSAAGRRFVDEVFRQLELLKTHPRLGRMVPEVGDAAVRELLLKQHRLIYEVSADDEVVHVLTIQAGRRPLYQFQ
jgi:plasmid stabilization system protein ParE